MSHTYHPKQEHQTPAAVRAQGAILPRDPHRAISEIMQIINNLHTVYEKETEALESHNTNAFLSMQDEKLEVARQYQIGIQEFMKRREEMKKADPSISAKLQALQDTFSTLTQKNMAALTLMKSSVERLNGTLRSIAKEAVQKDRTFSYGETGRIDVDRTKPVSTGITETA